MSKNTMVLGASAKPHRFSCKAIRLLRALGHEVIAVGKEAGTVADVAIQSSIPLNEVIHTVTLYINPTIQKSYYDTLLQLKPRRIIFNPGTENSELKKLAGQHGIETEYACTLVLLQTGQY
jgi:predicted CoA-binding protein